jgi:hypothetical protein
MTMKRSARVLLIGIAAVILGYPIYARRFQIEAKVWHWRHGHSTNVGEYEVPVPDHWLVEGSEDPTILNLVDTRVRKTGDPLSNVSILTISLAPSPPRDIDAWASLTRQSIEHRGVASVEEKTFRTGDETVVCLGGQELREILHAPSVTAVSLECSSTGRLELGFSGPRVGLQEFYSIASGIHKRK